MTSAQRADQAFSQTSPSSASGASRPRSDSAAAMLCDLLRRSRQAQGLSQMELALRLGFSPRHIGFVEIGRARPSRLLIEQWLAEVDAPASIRSAALHHAGFAPRPPSAAGAPGGGTIPSILDRLLEAHEPFPAFVFDANWIIRRANGGATWLMSAVMPDYMRARQGAVALDMIDCCTDREGLLSQMVDARAFGYALLDQLELERAANPALRFRVSRLAASLQDRYGPRPDLAPAPLNHAFTFETRFGRFELFRFQSLVDLPQDVTLQSARVEIALPVSEETRRALRHHAPVPDQRPMR